MKNFVLTSVGVFLCSVAGLFFVTDQYYLGGFFFGMGLAMVIGSVRGR